MPLAEPPLRAELSVLATSGDPYVGVYSGNPSTAACFLEGGGIDPVAVQLFSKKRGSRRSTAKASGPLRGLRTRY